ncbi:MAG: hypothetical protein ABI609_02665 [Acidobacteriota bacterium]
MPLDGASDIRIKADRRAWHLVAGLAFGAAYAVFYCSQPHLPGEFSYLPVMGSLPFSPMRGFTFEQLVLHAGRLVLLGPALVFLGWGLAGRLAPRHFAPANLRRVAVLVGALSLLVSAVVMAFVLRGGAITDDELTYRDQAAMLVDGRVADARAPWVGWEPFTIQSKIGLTGKYLFGEPLVQVPGVLLGLPGIMHLGLAGLTLLAWFRLNRSAAGPTVAAWSTMLLALSPMFMLTTSTGLSHSTGLACVVLAGLGVSWCHCGALWRGALLAGMALGFGLTVRPQVILPVGVVLGFALADEFVRARRIGPPLAFLGVCGAWVALVAWYNRLLTGSPWVLPMDLYRPPDFFGFVGGHTLWRACENLAFSVLRFNGWWLGLPFGLGVLLVWFAVGKPRAGLGLWAGCGLALVAFNFFYYSPGVSDTGPVYYFELLLPASLLAAHTLTEALRRWPALALSLLVVHVGLGTGTFLFEQGSRLSRLHHAIHDRVDRVTATIQTPALLIHEKLPAESSNAGWVFSFPIRYRSDRDPIVTYPRHSAAQVAALRQIWSERHCYYYRVEPTSHQAELYRCEQAEAWLGRPKSGQAEGVGYVPPSAAARLGLVE